MSRCSRPICLTAWLLAVTLAPACPLKAVDSQQTAKPSASESKIEQLLKKPISVSFRDVSLAMVLKDLRTVHGINIVLDEPALKEDGIDRATPVSIQLEEVALRSALNLILHQCQLTWVVKDDVLLVTTEKQASGALKQVTYQVADLVIPVNRSPVVLTCGDVVQVERPTATKPVTTEKELIQFITSTIAPRQWSEAGGLGTIDYHPLSMSLVINQRADIQEQVDDLLIALRRLQDQEVSLEIRILRVSFEVMERVRLQIGGNATKVLTAEEFAQLLKAAQGDPDTEVMQAPKLTLFNGQQSTFHFAEAGKGLVLNVLPSVKDDRRSLNMVMMQSLWNTAIGHGFAWEAVVPDGGTVVSRGWTRTREVTSEPPILSKIPYVSRLFKTGPHQRTEQVLVCVTPRLVVPEEEEVRQSGFVQRTEFVQRTGFVKTPAPPACAEKEPTPAEQAQELVRQYHQFCVQGDLKKAKKLARKALNLDPTCFAKQP